MTALYGREAANFTPAAVEALPKEARAQLTAATMRFKEILAVHNRILTRVRNSTEGMIKAIADDVAKRRAAQRPYSPTPSAPRSPGALIYNSVV